LAEVPPEASLGEVPESAIRDQLPVPGDVIAGKYRILRPIGEGGMGHVFEATHLRLGQRVAIKVLKPGASQSPEVMSRFDREARAAGRLRGRHAARVIDVDLTTERLPYLVLEYLEGHDLQTELERRGHFPIDEAVDYVLQACVGIAEAHDIGVIHRDLKPSNLFLCDEADRRIVKILDFGISKILDEASRLTSTELTVGTPLYMSPEQVRSARTVDARTDVWALGIILFELLTGRLPWTGSGPAVAAAIVTDPPPPMCEFRTDIPTELEGIIRKALAKSVDDRFADVRALAAALAPFAGSPTSLGRVSLDSARRAAQSGISLITSARASELGNAPTLLVGPSSDPSAPAGSVRTLASKVETGPATTGWGPKAEDPPATRAKRSRFAYGAAVLIGVAAVAVAVGLVTLGRNRTKVPVLAEPTATIVVASTGTAPPSAPPPLAQPNAVPVATVPAGSPAASTTTLRPAPAVVAKPARSAPARPTAAPPPPVVVAPPPSAANPPLHL
jgi:eukaryotic-like serine/threonine-protein kinase